MNNTEVMSVSEIKAVKQKEAAQSWINKGCKGTLEWATGTGKTFAALTAVFYYLNQIYRGSNNLEVLILAETTLREDTIKEDIAKFKRLYGIDLMSVCNFSFACYQSSYKWKKTHFNVVIADEIHDSLTPEYFKYYKNNTYDALIGLSATINRSAKLTDEPDSLTKGQLLNEIAPVVHRISQDQAIQLGLIAPYSIIVLYSKLNAVDKVIEAGTKKNRFYTTEQKQYEYIDQLTRRTFFKNASTPAEIKSKQKAIKAMVLSRARVIFNLPSKIKTARLLVDNIENKKVIFGNSLDALYQITPNVVSSRNKKATKNTEGENEILLDKFTKGEIRDIAAFQQLKQGANLAKDIDLAILHSYFSVSKDFIQRTGRILRTEGEGKKAYLIVMVTIGTEEESWFYKMKQESSAEVIEFSNPEDVIEFFKKQNLER